MKLRETVMWQQYDFHGNWLCHE